MTFQLQTSPILRSPLRSLHLSLLAQLPGFGAGLLFLFWFARMKLVPDDNTLLLVLAIHACVAFVSALLLRLSVPWRAFSALVAPCAILFVFYQVPAWIGAVLLLGSLLLYLPVLFSGVPYYPTSSSMFKLVGEKIPRNQPFKFVDLGCGFGGLLAHLSHTHPLGEYHGVEISPLCYVICKLRFLSAGKKVHISFKSLWKLDLSVYDYVYAFLAPGPMPALWQKARSEMKSGSTFLTNTFAVPEAAQDQAQAKDLHACRLYLHKMN
jgi:hypothetical protein